MKDLDSNRWVIDEKTWANTSEERKSWIIYQDIIGIHKRLRRIESWWFGIAPIVGGGLGAIVVVLADKLV